MTGVVGTYALVGVACSLMLLWENAADWWDEEWPSASVLAVVGIVLAAVPLWPLVVALKYGWVK